MSLPGNRNGSSCTIFPMAKSNVSASQVPQRIVTVVAIRIKNSPRHPGYVAVVFHHPTVSSSFSIHSAKLLHAGQDKASVLAPRYSCAGVFHPGRRQTVLPKHSAEG